MSAFLHTILKEKKIAGIEAVFGRDGQLSFNMVILQNRKGNVGSVVSYEGISAAEIAEHAGNLPVCMVVTGRGFIHKKLEDYVEGEDYPIGRIIPTGDKEKFYSQLSLYSELAVMSVVRKEQITTLLKDLGNLNIISCSVGPFVIGVAADFIEGGNVDVMTAGFLLRFRDHTLVDFTQDPEGYSSIGYVNIGEEQIIFSLLPAYSTALAYYTDNFEGISITNIDAQRKKVRTNRIIKLSLGVSVILLFALLFLNFIAFSYLFEQNKELNVRLAIGRKDITYLDSLRKEQFSRQSFLDQHALRGTSRVSFYADDLVHDMPSSVSLLRLNLFPSLRATEDDTLSYENGVIRISGNCINTPVLNAWIDKLQQKTWVDRVAVLNVLQNKNQQVINFNLMIDVK